ncbi:hypothetical protein GmHk_18G051763 [Glycine max]|nr:hypothetical protein GmHk_18G051763 [Glycine max]
MLRNLTDYVIIPFLPSGTLRNFTDCALTLPFNFRHVTELHGVCNNAFLLASGMSRNFTNCLTMGAKYLEVVKRGSHPNNGWSPDEIRGNTYGIGKTDFQST